MERANAPIGIHPVVYDCLEMSPFYDIEDPNDQYIDEKDAIDVPAIDANEPVSDFQKKYYMGQSNLPY